MQDAFDKRDGRMFVETTTATRDGIPNEELQGIIIQGKVKIEQRGGKAVKTIHSEINLKIHEISFYLEREKEYL